MICIGCGEKIIGEPYWFENKPYCTPECAEASLEDDDLFEEDYEEFDYEEFEEDYD